jgi:hypothetical protein
VWKRLFKSKEIHPPSKWKTGCMAKISKTQNKNTPNYYSP